MPVAASNSRLAFGLYEIDLQAGELWKAGFRIKLQSQPFKVLTALLEKPGQVVTREELQLRLWGRDTVVDFDHSLGTAINKIREALGDSADNPRFIETLSRRGYRFIAPVTLLAELVPAPVQVVAQETLEPAADVNSRNSTAPAGESETVSQAAPARRLALVAPISRVAGQLRPRAVPLSYVGVTAGLLLTLAVFSYFLGRSEAKTPPTRIERITQSGHLATNLTDMEDLAAGVTDGVHLFAPLIDNGHTALAAIALSDGAIGRVDIPAEIASPSLGDISPDGSRLLLREHLSPESEQPLWVVPTIGGSAQRIGNALAHDATWMPDGNGILYANGNELYLTHVTGNNPELFARLPGRAFWLRWSPSGKELRFTIIDPINHTFALWQITSSDRKPKRLLTGFTNPASECCGVWNAEGNRFIFPVFPRRQHGFVGAERLCNGKSHTADGRSPAIPITGGVPDRRSSLFPGSRCTLRDAASDVIRAGSGKRIPLLRHPGGLLPRHALGGLDGPERSALASARGRERSAAADSTLTECVSCPLVAGWAGDRVHGTGTREGVADLHDRRERQ